MATTPGTSLASTACFSTPAITVRAGMTLPCARARRGSVATAATAAAPFNTSRRLCGVMAYPSSALRRIDPHDLVEPAPPDVERGVRDELDDLRLGEVAAQLGPQRLVHFLVIDGELLGVLAEVPDLRVDLVDRQRRDPRHRRLLNSGCRRSR